MEEWLTNYDAAQMSDYNPAYIRDIDVLFECGMPRAFIGELRKHAVGFVEKEGSHLGV